MEGYMRLLDQVYRTYIDGGDWKGMISKYAPSSDNNNVEQYTDQIQQWMEEYRRKIERNGSRNTNQAATYRATSTSEYQLPSGERTPWAAEESTAPTTDPFERYRQIMDGLQQPGFGGYVGGIVGGYNRWKGAQGAALRQGAELSGGYAAPPFAYAPDGLTGTYPSQITPWNVPSDVAPVPGFTPDEAREAAQLSVHITFGTLTLQMPDGTTQKVTPIAEKISYSPFGGVFDQPRGGGQS